MNVIMRNKWLSAARDIGVSRAACQAARVKSSKGTPTCITTAPERARTLTIGDKQNA